MVSLSFSVLVSVSLYVVFSVAVYFISVIALCYREDCSLSLSISDSPSHWFLFPFVIVSVTLDSSMFLRGSFPRAVIFCSILSLNPL